MPTYPTWHDQGRGGAIAVAMPVTGELTLTVVFHPFATGRSLGPHVATCLKDETFSGSRTVCEGAGGQK